MVEDTASEAQNYSHWLSGLRHVMLILWPFPAGLSERLETITHWPGREGAQ